MTRELIKEADYDTRYYFVWCTKYMRPVLEQELTTRLEELLHEKAAEMGGQIHRAILHPDTIHLICSFPPRFAPYQIAYGLKDYTAHVLRQEFSWLNSRLPNLWTRSYYVGTLGHEGELRISEYLSEQARTNRPRSGANKLLD